MAFELVSQPAGGTPVGAGCSVTPCATAEANSDREARIWSFILKLGFFVLVSRSKDVLEVEAE